jgi:hypothetical protein
VLRVFLTHSNVADHLLVQPAGRHPPEEPNQPA